MKRYNPRKQVNSMRREKKIFNRRAKAERSAIRSEMKRKERFDRQKHTAHMRSLIALSQWEAEQRLNKQVADWINSAKGLEEILKELRVLSEQAKIQQDITRLAAIVSEMMKGAGLSIDMLVM